MNYEVQQGIDVTEHHPNCEHIRRSCICLTLKQVSDKFNIPESTLRDKWGKGLLPSFFKLFGRIKTFECWFGIWLKESQMKKPLGLLKVFKEPLPDKTSQSDKEEVFYG